MKKPNQPSRTDNKCLRQNPPPRRRCPARRFPLQGKKVPASVTLFQIPSVGGSLSWDRSLQHLMHALHDSNEYRAFSCGLGEKMGETFVAYCVRSAQPSEDTTRIMKNHKASHKCLSRQPVPTTTTTTPNSIRPSESRARAGTPLDGSAWCTARL